MRRLGTEAPPSLGTACQQAGAERWSYPPLKTGMSPVRRSSSSLRGKKR
uniref:Uncharacterized protein n=1 Tax=Anguilla anguilla TaxID=7936 RepID=A0A0E9TT18_ANGAN